MPNAYAFLTLGMADYKAGNYSAAVDALQTAYDLASRDGAVRIMLEAKLFLQWDRGRFPVPRRKQQMNHTTVTTGDGSLCSP